MCLRAFHGAQNGKLPENRIDEIYGVIMNENVPTYDSMMNPLLIALDELGGSGTIEEIDQKTIELMKIPEEILEMPHGEKGYKSEVEYRLAWTKTYLKRYGLLENSNRGIWSLKPEKRSIKKVDSKEVVSFVRNLDKINRDKKSEIFDDNDIDTPQEVQNWRDKLKSILIEISPDSFERLIRRMLRESGFSQVEVTGKTGDGGIDGKGIFRIGGIISFNVLFQCKRWKNSVGPSEIRDFRGAMQGRADKGLFVTTSTFTRDATKEASRDGATPIDLMDGDSLLDKLKELKLGISIEIVEKIDVDREWYLSI
jgi:restriction system protein